jgi:hypothetical protein
MLVNRPAEVVEARKAYVGDAQKKLSAPTMSPDAVISDGETPLTPPKGSIVIIVQPEYNQLAFQRVLKHPKGHLVLKDEKNPQSGTKLEFYSEGVQMDMSRHGFNNFYLGLKKA